MLGKLGEIIPMHGIFNRMNPKEIKIIFMGTPYFAAIILEKIIAKQYNVAAVFTQPNKKFGRKQEPKKSPVKELAEKNNIPIFEPQDLKEGSVAEEMAKMPVRI